MTFRTILTSSFRGLRAHPSRTLLASLGIVIGIMTIVLVFAAGEGFKGYINAQIEVFGANTITIETAVPKTTRDLERGRSEIGGTPANQAVPIRTLTYHDIEAIRKVPGVRAAYGAVLGQFPVAYGDVSKTTFIFGADADRFLVDQLGLSSGRFFTGEEDKGLYQVAILGSKIASDLFGDQDPVGKNIRMGAFNFSVIGVYKPRGGIGFSNDDDQVFVPVSTLQKKMMGIDYLFYGIASLDSALDGPLVKQDIETIVRENHNITDPIKDDFAVRTQAENTATFDIVLKVVTALLVLIALISLVVGGVGISNIMYASVTERIPEIGLKKAIGAPSRIILEEFLTEAVILVLGGGIVGVLLAAGIAYGIAKGAQAYGIAWVYSVPPYAIFLALGFSLVVGLIAGVFPARRAAHLDPIESLRYE